MRRVGRDCIVGREAGTHSWHCQLLLGPARSPAQVGRSRGWSGTGFRGLWVKGGGVEGMDLLTLASGVARKLDGKIPIVAPNGTAGASGQGAGHGR